MTQYQSRGLVYTLLTHTPLGKQHVNFSGKHPLICQYKTVFIVLFKNNTFSSPVQSVFLVMLKWTLKFYKIIILH